MAICSPFLLALGVWMDPTTIAKQNAPALHLNIIYW